MSASPSYGERPPLQGGFRRSFTLPARQLSVHEQAGLDKSDANANILYAHPGARIIGFSPPTESIKSNNKAEIPPDTDYPVDTVETLPWRSRTETLAATGPMLIEKVRGSTNFLKCQGVTQAILRNSQCWCVDGESKFVLRVRKFQYYRIELPSQSEEDKARVDELKKVFPMVLRYERTPCPFIRAFTVELPDDAITPRRKGQWKRRDSSQPNTPELETPTLRRTQPTRSYSLRTPPTSYPRGGPDSNLEGERGRLGQARAPSFLRKDYNRSGNDSPSRDTASDDGTGSEHHGSEHESEMENIPDRSAANSPLMSSTGIQSADTLRKAPEDIDVIQVSKRSAFVTPNTTAALEHKEVSAEDVPSPVTAISSLDPARAEVANQHLGGHHQVIHNISQAATTEAEIIHILDTDDTTPPYQNKVEDLQSNQQQFEHQLPDVLHMPAFKSSDIDAKVRKKEDEIKGADTVERGISPIQDANQTEAQSSPLDNSCQNKTTKDMPDTTAVQLDPESECTTEAQVTIDASERLHEHDTQSSETSISPEPLLQPHLSDDSSSSQWEDQNVEDIDEQLRELEALLQPAQTLSLDENSPRDDGSIQSRTSPLFTALLENVELSKPLPRSITLEDMDDNQDDERLSTVSSVDSFHTIASPPAEESNDDETLDAVARGRLTNPSFQHKRELSEITVTASSVSDPASPGNNLPAHKTIDQHHLPSLLYSSASDVSWPEPSTPSPGLQGRDGIRQRRASHRSFSPPPPASTIFTVDQIRHDSGSGHMTKVILQKIIIKPFEMAILVVHILARIAGGATVSDLLSGELFKRPEHRRRVSGFADQLHEGRSTSDTEDDYGVPVRGRRKSSVRRHAMIMDEEDDHHLEDVD